MKLTRIHKAIDSKIFYLKSALSSSLAAGCGLKHNLCYYIGVGTLSSSLAAGCGLKRRREPGQHKTRLSSSLAAGCGLKLSNRRRHRALRQLSSSLPAGCGLKPRHLHNWMRINPTFIQPNSRMWIETNYLGVVAMTNNLSFNFIVECGLKLVMTRLISGKTYSFIQLHCWMWIETNKLFVMTLMH